MQLTVLILKKLLILKWKDSNFDFEYVRLCNLDNLREKWLNYLQTVETLIIHCILLHLIRVCTVCQFPFLRGLQTKNGLRTKE